jgi:uncharacterized protein YkwD
VRRCSRLVATLLAAASLAIFAPATGDARSRPPAGPSDDAYASRILSLLNRERTRYGLRPLQRSRCSTSWAERWSSTMASSQRLHHQSMRSMLRECGARRAAENIAYGNVSAEEMMKKWMSSRGHRANILDPKLGYVGVGAARSGDGNWYAVQDFLGF